MGIIETCLNYKTKGILEIFIWHMKQQGFNKYNCDEISKLPERFQTESLDIETYSSYFSIPTILVQNQGKIEISNLQTTLLLFTFDEQGNRIQLFKDLTNDPEKLIRYFR